MANETEDELVERLGNAMAKLYRKRFIEALREEFGGLGQGAEDDVDETDDQYSSSEDDENIIDLDEYLSQFNRKSANSEQNSRSGQHAGSRVVSREEYEEIRAMLTGRYSGTDSYAEERTPNKSRQGGCDRLSGMKFD